MLAVVCLAAGAAACDDGDADGSQPRRGGVLRIGVTNLSANLDPAQARYPEDLFVADQLFDSLTAYDPRTLAPVPAVAERWQATPDQQHWEFTLRAGVSFANGRAVTADDVKYSLERVARKGSGSPYADLLEPVAGFRAFNSEGTAPGLAGVVVPGPNVVRIDLDAPFAELPAALASPALGIVPREAVEATAPAPPFSERPVGSGPFVLRSQDRARFTLVRAPRSRAFVDRMEVGRYADAGASYRAFLAGRLDWTRVPPEEVEEAARRYGRDGFSPFLAELFYGFNLKDPKFADPRFREAIVRAVNRDGIVRGVYQGTVRALDGVLLDGLPGFQQGACGQKCKHDPARARALLAEAFPAGGIPEVGIDYDEDPTQEAVAKAIQGSLQEVGISTVLRPLPPKDYETFAVSGARQLFRLGWIPPFASPDAFLPALFSSGSPNNLTGLSSPAVDEKLRQARAEPDAAKRAALYREAEHAVLELMPVLPIAQFEIQSIMSQRVRGLQLTPTGSFDAGAVWLTGG